MKVRIKFSKTGALVYIGHLDVMRFFQKLFRRADIPIAYSEGFSPHQILSFSHPLPLGMESEGEYADIELTDKISSADAISRLREKTVPEIDILTFKELPERAENAMASVRAARYHIDLSRFDDCKIVCSNVDDFMGRDTVVVTKTTKKSTKEEDIRPFIYELSRLSDSSIEILAASGSQYNLKPELVMKALFDMSGVDFEVNDLVMKRIEQYTVSDGRFVSLDDIGMVIA